MKVYYHSAIEKTELQPGEVYRVLPCESSIELFKEKNDDEYDVRLNGIIVDPNTTEFACNEEAELVVRNGSERHIYSVKPLIRPLSIQYAHAYEQFAYELANITSNELDSIRTGKLRLYAIDSSTEVKDWSDLFDSIDTTLHSLKFICEQPKSHLKAANEVRPIETVKRVGYESIPYLAAHSEDWLARTASGLQPARLFSRVEDDEYQIYENRVVKTLIDMVISFLRKTEKHLHDQRDQLRGIINSSVQTGGFGFDVSFQKAVSELISFDLHADEHRTKSLELAEKLQRRSYTLLRKYRALRQSRLYRYLKKSKPVTNPLNETNILLLDKHYSKAFLLWKALHQAIAPKAVDEANQVPFISTYKAYTYFCSALCGYAAHTLGFSIIEDGHYFRESDQLDITIRESHGLLNVDLCDKERCSALLPGEIKVPIPIGSQHGKFSYDGKSLSWENDVTTDEIDDFCSLFKTNEGRGKDNSDVKYRYSKLKQFLIYEVNHQKKAQRSSIALHPAVIELDVESRSALLSYVTHLQEKNIGRKPKTQIVIALPICEEDEQKVTRYSKDVNTLPLVLPLTMFDINSFRRIQHLFLRHILKLNKSTCPSCGNNMRSANDQSVCDVCNQQLLTQTKCPDCHYEYTYISYNLSDDTIEQMRNMDEHSFYQLDSLFQYKDVVDMSVASGKLRTICPNCHQ